MLKARLQLRVTAEMMELLERVSAVRGETVNGAAVRMLWAQLGEEWSQNDVKMTPKRRQNDANLTPGDGKPDPRHAQLREAIKNLYRETFKLECPWGPGEAGQLGQFLKAVPGVTVEELTVCVRNRFRSEGVSSERPMAWLADLSKYGSGPLDKFGKTKRELKPAPVKYLTSRYSPEMMEAIRKANED